MGADRARTVVQDRKASLFAYFTVNMQNRLALRSLICICIFRVRCPADCSDPVSPFELSFEISKEESCSRSCEQFVRLLIESFNLLMSTMQADQLA